MKGAVLGVVVFFGVVGILAGCGSADERVIACDGAPPDTTIPTPASAAPAPSSAAATLSASDDYQLEAGEQRFEGVYGSAKEPDDGKPRMRFEGTFVKLDDGGEVILSYDEDKAHASLIGKRVIVIGNVYHPEGRSVGGTHVHARILAEKK